MICLLAALSENERDTILLHIWLVRHLLHITPPHGTMLCLLLILYNEIRLSKVWIKTQRNSNCCRHYDLWLRRLWEIPDQFTLQYTSFNQHKEIMIEEIHVAGTAMRVAGKGSRNQPFFSPNLLYFCECETLLYSSITWSAGMYVQRLCVEAAVLELGITFQRSVITKYTHIQKYTGHKMWADLGLAWLCLAK